MLRQYLNNLVCRAVGHHPDDLQIVPVGFTVDGDFCHLRLMACRRCRMQAEVYLVEPALSMEPRSTDD